MDGPGRVKGGMGMQGSQLYPQAEVDLIGITAMELHSPGKPEKLQQGNEHLDTPYL